MGTTIRFLGGAGTVTGSKYLVQDESSAVLVDCGLFQGVKSLRLLNREPLAIDMPSLKAVILTHAHLDHSGYLPLLLRHGFAGRIFATPPTRALAELILRDSAALQEEEAELANEMGFSRHAPALPLYTTDDVETTLRHFVVRDDNEWIDIGDGIRFRYERNGHILGSAFIELDWKGRTIVFSGDVGRTGALFLENPQRPKQADVLVVESTYGDRLHPADDPAAVLADIVRDTYRRGGMLIIPSFAVGRAQELMVLLHRLRHSNAIPDIPIYLDSPMGLQATEIMRSFPTWHTLPDSESDAMWSEVRMIRKFRETIELLRSKASCIVIAGSGMATGGRVLHYLKERLEDERSTVLLVGYQAEGTRGRQLMDGVHEVKIHGAFYRVQARVCAIRSLSAHADQRELIDWLSELEKPPAHTFIVHGEPQAADALRVKLRERFQWEAIVPRLFDTYLIDS